MADWKRIADGEYNEQTAAIEGHEVTIFSDRTGVEWMLSIDGSEPMPMEASEMHVARREAEHEARLWGK